MAWDGRDNGGATSRGVTGHDDPTCPDCIQVAILGANPFYDADVNSDAPVQAGPALPTGEDLRVLRQYFQSHFQTFGRRVWFRGWGYPCPASSAKDAIDSMVKELHPFAVIMGQYSDGGWCNTPQAEVDADLTAHGLETFVFSSPEGKYFGADNLDGSVLHASSPFLWSFQPSVNGDITDGATWVCQTLVGKPPTETIDPTIKAAALTGQPRRLALGYRTVSSLAATSATNANAGDRNAYLSSSKDVADRFAAAVDATCGHGGHVFEQFNCPPSPCDQDLWVEDNYFSGLGAVFGQSNDPQVAANAVSALKSHHDTSLICVLCGVPSSAGEANQNPDEFAEAEYQNQYFPEHIFVGGTDEDPWGARQHDQPTFNGAFGLSELWQVGGYTQTYWYRAYNSVTSQATISMPAGFEIYEQMMQVFSAVQLAGPDLNPTTLQWGSDGRGGLYSWTRGNRPAAGVLHPDSSPAAGYTAQRHWFLRGLVEERWDSGGSPPGGPYQAVFGTAGGCYRIIDPALRYSSEGWPGTAPWPSGPGSDHSDEIAASAPCTGDYGTDV